MKISFIGHASILIETKGIKVLSDPWWGFPCFGSQWWTYPMPKSDHVIPQEIDYIYISHGHHDHLHLGTLKQFKETSTLLVSSKLNLAPALKKYGYKVISIDPDSPHQLLSGLECHIWPTYGGDTLMVLNDDSQCCVNANDALHAAPESIQDIYTAKLKKTFGTINYLFCGYGIASHFPNCYRIPDKDDSKSAFKRQKHFNAMWGRVVKNLEPEYAFPFAADVAFLEDDLLWTNEAVHNAATPTEDLAKANPDIKTKMVQISPGFIINNNSIEANPSYPPPTKEVLLKQMPKQYELANRHGKTSREQILGLLKLIQANIELCKDYLAEVDRNYVFKINIRNCTQSIIIKKSGDAFESFLSETNNVAADVTLTTRSSYLRRSLMDKYGSEVLFVGSGAIFSYAKKEDIINNIHNELKVMISHWTTPPKSRFGDNTKQLFKIKQFIKRCIGKRQTNLYDLTEWTTFKEKESNSQSAG